MYKILVIIGILTLSSCNPKMHIYGSAMRHHNLSQNKYQPNKQRKQIRVGPSPISPFWLIFGRF